MDYGLIIAAIQGILAATSAWQAIRGRGDVHKNKSSVGFQRFYIRNCCPHHA